MRRVVVFLAISLGLLPISPGIADSAAFDTAASYESRRTRDVLGGGSAFSDGFATVYGDIGATATVSSSNLFGLSGKNLHLRLRGYGIAENEVKRESYLQRRMPNANYLATLTVTPVSFRVTAAAVSRPNNPPCDLLPDACEPDDWAFLQVGWGCSGCPIDLISPFGFYSQGPEGYWTLFEFENGPWTSTVRCDGSTHTDVPCRNWDLRVWLSATAEARGDNSSSSAGAHVNVELQIQLI